MLVCHPKSLLDDLSDLAAGSRISKAIGLQDVQSFGYAFFDILKVRYGALLLTSGGREALQFRAQICHLVGEDQSRHDTRDAQHLRVPSTHPSGVQVNSLSLHGWYHRRG